MIATPYEARRLLAAATEALAKPATGPEDPDCTCPYCTRMRGLVEHYRREVALADERQNQGAFG